MANSSARQAVPRSSWLVGTVLVILLLFRAIPSYLQGDFVLAHSPEVKALPALRQLSKEGLTIPDWSTLAQQEQRIAGQRWLEQVLQPDSVNKTLASNSIERAVLLLRPQLSSRSQPQLEWSDLQGGLGWTEDSQQVLKFPATGANRKQVKARFLRAWFKTETGTIPTNAVVEWYAWLGGGSYHPDDWFWADHLARLSGQRRGWVAIAIILPMEPLGNLTDVKPMALDLATAVEQSVTAYLEPESSR